MMKASHLDQMSRRISAAVRDGRISHALSDLLAMAQATGAPWTAVSEIEKLGESYGYLRRYALDGVPDPSRKAMLAELGRGIEVQARKLVRRAMIEESATMYFSTLRYEHLQKDSSISEQLERYRTLTDRLELAMLSVSGGAYNEVKQIRREHAETSRRLFGLLWTNYSLTEEQETKLLEFLTDSNVRVQLRAQLLGSLLLALTEYYDERKLCMLGKLYLAGEKGIELKALIVMLLGMWMQRDHCGEHMFRNLFTTIREKDGWREDLKLVFLTMVRTRDADRIAKTMNEELIPSMLKLRPEIFKKFGDRSITDDMDPAELNPEWEDLLEKSGVADKLKELNELQAEGSDVMLGTFAGLKSFPFFHELSNWFMPFFTEQSDVADVLAESAEDLGEMIDMAPMICDSDKYSIVFSLGQMPSANRRMMLEQFRMQNINVADLRNSMLNPEMSSRKDDANRYIHDLYRFFTLFRRKSEFKNPFAQPINLSSLPMLAPDLADNEVLEAVGEFYFKRGYYAEAADVFNVLLEKNKSDVTYLQKTGFCFQRLGRFDDAIAMYTRGELLAPDNVWNLRRLAQCLKQVGRHAEALPYYERLAEKYTDDLTLALNLGHCYLAVGDYRKALNCYFKVEYLDKTGRKAIRPIAWCAFVEGDLERAAKYYEKVLNDTPGASDYLNAGHLQMAKGNYRQAVRFYSEFLKRNNNTIASLAEAVESDRQYLDKVGVDADMISLVMDAVEYPDEV